VTVFVEWVGAMMGLGMAIPISKKATGGGGGPPPSAEVFTYFFIAGQY